MHTKKVYLICNAHIDPMWLWEWEEGAAAAVSTFRSAVGFCEKYDTFVFNHNEVLLYKWIEEYEPSLFERIKVQVKRGKWNIMGGWYLQPDCLMPSGEGFIRQISEGNKYFKEKFGVEFKTAINFDSFGHTRGLVQIMAKCGYENYLVCRPSKQQADIPNEFEWEGYDGSVIRTRRHYELYNSALGKAAEKIEFNINNFDEGENLMILWGVGNHGGGPSRKDIEDIDCLTQKLSKSGVNIMHTTPDCYFNETKGIKPLVKITKNLTPCNTGCLTSMATIKQKYRELESLLFTVEKMASAADIQGLVLYPKEELAHVIADMLLMQFHDILPGSGIKNVETAGIRAAEHGLEILSRLRARLFFALSKGEKSIPETYPVLVYNHHPYDVETTVECEFQLADQNWEDTFTLMNVFDESGVKLKSQIEKEGCNLNLDWRKRVVFNAVLKPMSMNSFVCKPYIVSGGRHFAPMEETFEFGQNTKYLLNVKTGFIEAIYRGGVNILSAPITLVIHEDNEDPWAMQSFQYEQLGSPIGKFNIMNIGEAQEYSSINAQIGSVRMIENGEVRTIIEALFKYKNSSLILKYTFYKDSESLEITADVLWCQPDRLLKLHVPYSENAIVCAETAFGVNELCQTGVEEDIQKWCAVKSDTINMGIINYGTYAASCKDNTLMLSLLRSPAYSGHPINEREILHQDRHTPRMDIGERNFKFKFVFGLNQGEISKLSQTENEKPFALSFFPLGEGEKLNPLLQVSGDGIIMTALKKADNGDGSVIRLYNSNKISCVGTVYSNSLKIFEKLSFGAYEVKTYKIIGNKLIETDMKENSLN